MVFMASMQTALEKSLKQVLLQASCLEIVVMVEGMPQPKRLSLAPRKRKNAHQKLSCKSVDHSK